MWRSSPRRKRRDASDPVARAGAVLVQECESFLTGRYAIELAARDLPVPGWAWLAVLTHAPKELLVAWVEQARAFGEDIGMAEKWCGAITMLATEILATAELVGRDPSEVQHLIIRHVELVPGSGGGSPATPDQLVGRVLDTLDGYGGEPG